uniref:Uncharacterized protein zf(C2h2)-96 n=1 Tax=Phallusia mammillata TaxID=59560 RepID=A0A6F9DX70_9ASCI|nr:uncharacterized protein zf(c2h2)-96 [Phallusia mammillata]
MNGISHNHSKGIFERLYSENGFEEMYMDTEEQPSIPMFEDIHQLILKASQKLADFEKPDTSPEEQTLKPSSPVEDGLDQPMSLNYDNGDDISDSGTEYLNDESAMSETEEEDRPENNAEFPPDTDDLISDFNQVEDEFVDDNVHGIPRRRFSFTHYVMLKRNGKYHCSECVFKTSMYKRFYSHFSKFHKKVAREAYLIVNGKVTKDLRKPTGELTYMYRCSMCKFITMSFRGFKIHATSRHTNHDHKNIIRYLPVNHPKAHGYYQSYLNSLQHTTQIKNVVGQFKPYFSCTQTENCVSYSSIIEAAQSHYIKCMRCSETFLYPSLLEKHYDEVHSTCGPCRDKLSKLFHCEKCRYRSESYRMLHKHFVDSHAFLVTEASKYLSDSDDSWDGNTPVELADENAMDQTTHTPEKSCTPEKTGPTIQAAKSPLVKSECLLKCDKCNFRTPKISFLLNHYRSSHVRNYPDFVENRIVDEFKQNVVLVEIPRKEIRKDWVNGWINSECTSLIHEPLYVCMVCNYHSTVFNTVVTHYNNHPRRTFSKRAIGVIENEAAEKQNEKKPYISLHRELFKCTYCGFSACFFQTMFNHYQAMHNDKVSAKTDFDKLIQSSVTNWCFKCTKNYDDTNDLINHIGTEHTKAVINFSKLPDNSYKCNFCKKVFAKLSDLAQDLQEHESDYNSLYEKNYVVAFCCSKCRRVFKGKRFMRHHYTRMHTEWTNDSFALEDIPDRFFVKPADDFEDDSVKKSSSTEDASEDGDADTSATLDLKMGEFVRLVKNHYVCKRCDWSTMNTISMRIHIKQVHQRYIDSTPVILNTNEMETEEEDDAKSVVRITVSSCSHVKWMTKGPSVFEKHVRMRHNTLNPYDCPYCKKSFVCQVILLMHTRKKHKNRPVPKIECKTDENREVSHSCTNRNIKKRSPLVYKRHVAEYHRTNPPFYCPKCDKAFICNKIFIKHLKKHHNIQEDGLKNQDSFGSKSGPIAVGSYKSQVHLKKKGIAKDYSHPKSVKVDKHWKCLYCNSQHHNYILLRKHTIKVHPSKQLFRCKWCDFICKTRPRHSAHVKIHYRFISARMKELRMIFKNKKINGLRSKTEKTRTVAMRLETPEISDTDEMGVTGLGDDHMMEETNLETDLNEEDESEQYLPPPVSRKARKSTKHHSPRVKDQLKLYPKVSPDAKLIDGFHLLEDGRILCKYCNYVSIDRSRMMIHLRACHSTFSGFSCQLCSFSSEEFKEIRKHLVDYHKMEKNHHLAIDFSVNISKDERERLSKLKKSNGLSRHTRRLDFEPQPSLPIISTERPSKRRKDDVQITEIDFFSETSSVRRLETSDDIMEIPTVEPERIATRGTTGIRNNGKTAEEISRFKCKYCGTELSSTYEMEYHMRRHELGAVEAQNFNEDPLLLSKLCTFNS